MKLYNKQETKDLRRKLRKDQTPEERKIWNLIRNRKLLELKFFRQYSVEKYILDFYCPLIKLCIEVDGGQHNLDDSKLYDTHRTNFLNSTGITVIRFWNNDINKNIEGVYQTVCESAIKIINSPRPSL